MAVKKRTTVDYYGYGKSVAREHWDKVLEHFDVYGLAMDIAENANCEICKPCNDVFAAAERVADEYMTARDTRRRKKRGKKG